MLHLQKVLEKTNLRRHDIVVMTVRPITTGAGEYGLAENQIFSDYEKELFSRVVTMAEKEGKTVELLVVPAVDPFDAMVQTAAKLQASRLVSGVSARMASEELARRIGLAWERLPEPRHAFSLEVISPDRASVYVNLGPHPPRLWPEDLDRLHELWLRLTEEEGLGSRLHHRDVVGVALHRLEKDLSGPEKEQVSTTCATSCARADLSSCPGCFLPAVRQFLCRSRVKGRQDFLEELFLLHVFLGGRRLVPAIVVIAVAGAAAHLGGFRLHQGDDGVVGDATALHAVVVNLVAQS